jgi:hypothetical protein
MLLYAAASIFLSQGQKLLRYQLNMMMILPVRPAHSAIYNHPFNTVSNYQRKLISPQQITLP